MPLIEYNKAIKTKQLRPDAGQKHVIKQLEALERRFKKRQSRTKPSFFSMLTSFMKNSSQPVEMTRGLYIWGSVGRGKTHMMDLFYECLNTSKKQRLHFHRFMQEVHQQPSLIENQEDPLAIVANHFKRHADIICLDELFVSDIGDAMILAGLLEALFIKKVTLVCTSNCHPDQLYADGLQRQKFLPAIELIKSYTTIAELGGDQDHRLEFLEHADIYHTPLDENAQRIMLDNFLHVSTEQGAENETLHIHDHEINTVRCSDGVVWFDFNALCNGPRCASDYIEIARCFNTVLISDIPVMTHDDNAARRFITAIDEFYDRNVKVIISAEADERHLYEGKKLAFEIQRTQSRLIEMRSHDYLAKPHKSL